MDISLMASAIAPAAGNGFSTPSPYLQQQPGVVPAELVGKFEALMARVDGPASNATGPSALSAAAVNKVEDQLALHTQTLDNVLAVSDGNMSLIDLQAFQIRSITQAGVMSMTHAAYTQVLSAGKGSVSALMKNQ